MAAGFAEVQKAPPLPVSKGRAHGAMEHNMRIFAMADFHLSLSGEKPMTINIFLGASQASQNFHHGALM